MNRLAQSTGPRQVGRRHHIIQAVHGNFRCTGSTGAQQRQQRPGAATTARGSGQRQQAQPEQIHATEIIHVLALGHAGRRAGRHRHPRADIRTTKGDTGERIAVHQILEKIVAVVTAAKLVDQDRIAVCVNICRNHRARTGRGNHDTNAFFTGRHQVAVDQRIAQIIGDHIHLGGLADHHIEAVDLPFRLHELVGTNITSFGAVVTALVAAFADIFNAGGRATRVQQGRHAAACSDSEFRQVARQETGFIQLDRITRRPHHTWAVRIAQHGNIACIGQVHAALDVRRGGVFRQRCRTAGACHHIRQRQVGHAGAGAV